MCARVADPDPDLKDPHASVCLSRSELFSTNPDSDPDLNLPSFFKNVKTKNKFAKFNKMVKSFHKKCFPFFSLHMIFLNDKVLE